MNISDDLFEVPMASTSPPLMNLTWSLWKASWKEVLETAAISAGLEAGAFSLFLYMFVHDPNRVLPVVGASLVIFLFFHVGVSALHAKLISHPALSSTVAPITFAESNRADHGS
jgi:hypothetical protein